MLPDSIHTHIHTHRTKNPLAFYYWTDLVFLSHLRPDEENTNNRNNFIRPRSLLPKWIIINLKKKTL